MQVKLFWVLAILYSVTEMQIPLSESQTVPAIFVFGDSLADNGNNNFLPTLAKANSRPYGIDFPSGPTGRFCNGKTVSDYLEEFLGLPFSPPYLHPSTRGSRVLHGVNYASAAGGILEETGKSYGARMSFAHQISGFEKTLTDITEQLGSSDAVTEYLSKSLFMCVFGSNDYINNYLMPRFYPFTRLRYSSEAFRDLLVSEYTRHLTRLYSLGARKFVISLLGPLGCIPQQMAAAATGGKCLKSVNDLVEDFNRGLLAQLPNLTQLLPASAFVFHNCYDRVTDIIQRPTVYGFKDVADACCGFGRLNAQILCNMMFSPCPDRDSYVFWDSFHPTQAVNYILAKAGFDGEQFDAYPINIRTLAQL